MTCLVYLPAISGARLWDDKAHIPKPELQSIEGLYRIWFDVRATQQYYPLLFSSFWLQYHLWADHMLGYHVVTLMWHLLAALLVYYVVRGLKIPGALLAAALFALHPLHVESVAWVTEQKNTQSAVFYLAAMLAYLKFDQSRRQSTYALALGLFVAALLSKTVTVTLPPALLVIFWWQRGALSWRRDLAPLLPFFALSIASGLLTIWVERKVLNAEGIDFDLSFAQGLLLAGRASWFYLAKVLWPANLMFMYPRWEIDPADPWQWLYPVAALVALVGLWAMRNVSRAPLAAALFFVGTLLPLIGFLNVYFFRFSFVSDHFPYLASLGLIVLVAGAFTKWIQRFAPTGRTLAMAGCLLILGLFAVLACRETFMYRDLDSFYARIIADNPKSWMAYHNMGLAYMERNELPKAIEYITKSLEVKPDQTEGENNLGIALLHAGRAEEAAEHFRRAMQMTPKDPRPYGNLGAALVQLGRSQEAIVQFEQSLKLDPTQTQLHYNFGNALFSVGRADEAIAEFKQAIDEDPENAMAYSNWGAALIQIGRPQEAIKHLEDGLRLKPDADQAFNNLGMALMKLGRPQEAIPQFQRAVQIKPQLDDARYNLVAALLTLNQLPEAIVQLQELARRHPDDFITLNNLGSALLNAERAEEAIEPLEKAVALQPELPDTYCNLARALLQTGKVEEAAAQLEKAIQLKPDFPGAWANMSDVESKRNHPEAARAAAEKALDLARAAGQQTLVGQMQSRLTALGVGAPPPVTPQPPTLPPTSP